MMKYLGLDSLENGCAIKHLYQFHDNLLMNHGYKFPYYVTDTRKDFVSVSPQHPEGNQITLATSGEIVKAPEDWKLRDVLPPLYGIVFEQHFIKINDVEEKRKLRERNKRVTSEHFNICKRSIKKDKETCTYVTLGAEETLESVLLECNEVKDTCFIFPKNVRESVDVAKEKLFLDIIRLTKTLPKVKVSSTGINQGSIQEIYLPNGNSITVRDFTEIDLVEKGCETLGIPFKNQTISSLAHGIFTETYPNLKKSFLNDTASEVYSGLGKPSIFIGSFQWSADLDGYVAYDFPKFYRKSAYSNNRDFPVFSMFDRVVEYDATVSENGVKAGVYFVETKNVIPCQGNGWYSAPIIDFLRNHNVEFTIKYMLLSTWSIPHDYFKLFIDKVINGNFEEEFAKEIVNFLIGILGRKSGSCFTHIAFAQSIESAMHFR